LVGSASRPRWRRCWGGARLVTLTGTGGVGKTRLAIAVAESVGGQFGGGAEFVDLAPVARAEDVPAAVARAIGVRDDGGVPLLERLTTSLRDREVLLLLDNFEHVLSAAAFLQGLLEDWALRDGELARARGYYAEVLGSAADW